MWGWFWIYFGANEILNPKNIFTKRGPKRSSRQGFLPMQGVLRRRIWQHSEDSTVDFFNIDIPVPRFQRSKIYIAVLCNIYFWFQHYHLAPLLAQLTCIFFKVQLVVLIYLVFSLFGLNIQQPKKMHQKWPAYALLTFLSCRITSARLLLSALGSVGSLRMFLVFSLRRIARALFTVSDFFFEWGILLNYHDQTLNIVRTCPNAISQQVYKATLWSCMIFSRRLFPYWLKKKCIYIYIFYPFGPNKN